MSRLLSNKRTKNKPPKPTSPFFGVADEKGFPYSATMKPPLRLIYPFGGFFDVVFHLSKSIQQNNRNPSTLGDIGLPQLNEPAASQLFYRGHFSLSLLKGGCHGRTEAS
jgi:hypothetical protein